MHLSAGSKTNLTKWAGRQGRLHLNPRREATCSACGMVVRQHAANVRHAADVGLGFAHVGVRESPGFLGVWRSGCLSGRHMVDERLFLMQL